jgi:hypothetical protein
MVIGSERLFLIARAAIYGDLLSRNFGAGFGLVEGLLCWF